MRFTSIYVIHFLYFFISLKKINKVIRWPVVDISDVPCFFRKKYEPLFSPTVISGGNEFSTVVISGNLFPTVTTSRNVFPTVITKRGRVPDSYK